MACALLGNSWLPHKNLMFKLLLTNTESSKMRQIHENQQNSL